MDEGCMGVRFLMYELRPGYRNEGCCRNTDVFSPVGLTRCPDAAWFTENRMNNEIIKGSGEENAVSAPTCFFSPQVKMEKKNIFQD